LGPLHPSGLVGGLSFLPFHPAFPLSLAGGHLAGGRLLLRACRSRPTGAPFTCRLFCGHAAGHPSAGSGALGEDRRGCCESCGGQDYDDETRPTHVLPRRPSCRNPMVRLREPSATVDRPRPALRRGRASRGQLLGLQDCPAAGQG
jgi:hypothetical protein